MSDDLRKPQHWPMWIGIIAAIFAAGGSWYVTSERQQKQAETVTDHEQRLRDMEGNDTLKTMIVDLMVQSAQQTTKIEQLEKRIAELTAQRRR